MLSETSSKITCSICLGDILPANLCKTNCNHEFCKTCLDLWFDKFPQVISKRNNGFSTAKAKASNMLRIESLFSEAKKHIIDSIKLNPFNIKAWIIYFLIILKVRY